MTRGSPFVIRSPQAYLLRSRRGSSVSTLARTRRAPARVQRLARELSEFVRQNPQVKLDLEERPSISTIDAVLNKQADLGIIVRGFEVEGLSRELLLYLQIFQAVS